MLRNERDEFIPDPLLDQDAGGRVAALPGIEEHPVRRDLGDVVEVATPGGTRSYEIVAIRY
jgi:hypothetical protein